MCVCVCVIRVCVLYVCVCVCYSACDLVQSVLKYFSKRTIAPKHSDRLLSWFKLEQHFTRAAVYLLHRDPDKIVEEVFKPDINSPRVYPTMMPFASGASASAYSQRSHSQSPSARHTLSQKESSTSVEDLKKQQRDVILLISCAACGNRPSLASLKKCPCKMVAYCDKNCQRKDWIKHKLICTYAKKK